MFRNRTVAGKIRGTLFLVLLVASLLFSISFYAVSMNIMQSYVLPQFDKVLNTSIQDIYKNVSSSKILQVQSGGAGSEGAALTVESYLAQKAKEHNLDATYVVSIQEGKATVVIANAASEMKAGDEISVQSAMNTATESKEMVISDVYSDSFGVHKAAFIPIAGSNMIMAVSMDAQFIQDKNVQIFWLCLGITALVFVLGWLISASMIKRVTKPIIQLVQHSKQISQGDLTAELQIKGKDEIAQLAASFQTMTHNLKEMISRALSTSNEVVQGSDDLLRRVESMSGMVKNSSRSAEDAEKGSVTIASSAAENARAMEEITQGIMHIASSAAEVSEQIGEAANEAVNGNRLAQDAVQQMERVGQTANESLRYVETMNERSVAIGTIVTSIFEITKQINMLSLNASIEAARAGEHGRGFAVVAGEVRKLAEQSKTATEEIADYLGTIREDAERSVSAMNRVTQEIGSGTHVVQQAGTAFQQLNELIQNVNLTIQTVSASTEEVSAGAEEVSASVEETAQITSRSRESMQQIASTAEHQLSEMDSHSGTVRHLHEQAMELQSAMKKFKIN
ncbi:MULTISPECIES: methyl-accepting chemotaxis protein [Paenibacillus]|uniref:Methyl-accepting chemotaxis protein n=1 Tax=Paenibacillus illinoisensis TaxID=59845 RepID=A0A2W0C6N3_9BACL|nr:HAMP domain-containing methyl-accepting chemotaxis protein [Paenibacillus illinoisensis]PYY27584.1 Methyl-accepting chemotaxis protein [Paenibacillus illinoisensis]